ncbi:MAG: PAS domain-containing protein, partial [Isosphaeraceae bacterium]
VVARELTIEGDTYLEQLRQARGLFVIDDAQADPRVNHNITTLLKNRTIVHMPVEILGQRCLIGSGTFGPEGVVPLDATGREYFRAMAKAAALAVDRAGLAEKMPGGTQAAIARMPESLVASSFPMLTLWERNFRTGKLTLTPARTGQVDESDHHGIDSFEKYLTIIHPDDAPGLKAEVEAYVANPQGRLQLSYRLVLENGLQCWCYSEAGIVYDADHQPQKLAGIRFDITDRKNAELAVAAAESRLQLLLEEGEICLWEMDLLSPDKIYTSQAANYPGYGVAELPRTALAWQALVHPDDLEDNLRQFARFLEEKAGVFDHVIRLRHREGSYRYIRVRAVLQLDSLGRPLRVLGCHVDITAQRLAEIRLNAQAEHLKTLVREAPVPMVLLDREMNYLAVSSAWMNSLSRGYNDLIARNHFVVHPDLPDRWKTYLNRAQAGEFLKQDSDEWQMSDGRKLLIKWSIGPWFDTDGRIGGIFIAADDLTRQHELESDVVQLAERFRRQFSEDLHDTLCQELTSLAMYAESLGDSFAAGDDRSRAILGRIDQGLNRSIRDVRQMMLGQSPVQVKGPGFVQAIEELATLDKMLNMCEVQVVVESVPALADDFTATQLYRIVREALHNAVKHARPAAVLIRISARPHLSVSVQNTLADGQKSAVFEQKTGLGRQIMEHRAALIGGVIRFGTTERDQVQLTCEVERIRDDS